MNVFLETMSTYSGALMIKLGERERGNFASCVKIALPVSAGCFSLIRLSLSNIFIQGITAVVLRISPRREHAIIKKVLLTGFGQH